VSALNADFLTLKWDGVIGLIEKNQITKGGPIILLRIENEYYNGRKFTFDPSRFG
jgi:hypothetical protein